jgi:putative membrane protein
LYHRVPSNVTTLVACIDRAGDLVGEANPPVVGRAAVESLVVDVGVTDPEDSQVNALLEGLRVAADLEAEGDEAIVAVLSGTDDAVGADRAIASQVEGLIEDHEELNSAVIVVDSAEDERLVPIVESRLSVDAVDRVVVRQARDIESTYYLLKQFLADEELRKTVLVPTGVALIVYPVLWMVAGPSVATAAIITVVGLFLLYKGLGVDVYLSRVPGQVRDALYSGQVALVTYVVAGGLALVGVFAGALGVSATGSESPLVLGLRFTFDSVPWLTGAALAASTGRLLDELIRREGLRSAYLNLPFGAVAVGIVIRGFSAFLLEVTGVFDPFRVSATKVGPVAFEGMTLGPGARLTVFIATGIVVSLVGVRFAAYVSNSEIDEGFRPQREGQ